MSGRVVALGEIMLRLTPPGFEQLFQSPLLETSFGGSEANVAVSLAIFGLDVAMVTALPANAIGEGCLRFLRSHAVDTRHILRQGERMGLYFLETGANQRPSRVVYDRAHSAFSQAGSGDFDWEGIFDGAAWFHISGISPAVSASAAEVALAAVRMARERGLTVSCDYNYRQKLWGYGRSDAEVMAELLPYVDLLLAGERDCSGLLGRSLADLSPQEMGAATLAAFPNLKYLATTTRDTVSASHNALSARLYNGKELLVSQRYEITHIVDRVGGGDAFAAGLIYGLHVGMTEQEALEFAVAASVLKHSIPGDVNLSTVADVRQLLGGDRSGRVQR